jgi:DNA-binding MurR/RpiR family transcriptional regulator
MASCNDHCDYFYSGQMTSAQDWMRERTDGAALGPKAERVAHLLATNTEFSSYASAGAVAERAGVDAATVVRTARALGFTGWPALRLELRNRHLASLGATEVLDAHQSSASDPIRNALRGDLANLTLACRTVDVPAVRAVATALTEARRTVVVASGSFAGPAYQLAHCAAFMGLDVRFVERGGTTLANALTGLGSGDCLLAINFWRLPREVRQAAAIARAAGATTCVLTDLRRNALAKEADHLVTVPCEGTSHFPSLTAAMAVVHALLAEITRQRGDSTLQAIRHTEELWHQMNLMHE